MSEIPIIAEWNKQGFEWHYIFSPHIGVQTIPASSSIRLPKEGHIFNNPEGIVIYGSAIFDHPLCGAKMRADYGMDTKIFFVIQTILLGGLTDQEWGSAFVRVPPQTPPGYYALIVHSSKIWHNFLTLDLINVDSVPHNCLGFAYLLAVRGTKKIIPMEE